MPSIYTIAFKYDVGGEIVLPKIVLSVISFLSLKRFIKSSLNFDRLHTTVLILGT